VFTGLIEDVGTVESVESGADGARLRIATRLAGEVGEGDSIAVDGVCLTATNVGDGRFETDAMNQTLTVTGLGDLEAGARVNLELAMRASDRLGGHIVQGHVDGVGTLVARDPLADGSTRMRFAVPPALLRYVVEKGSITVDGISLTVAAVHDDAAAVDIAVIPHTLAVTTLGPKAPGDPVNIEVDVLAKHVERLLTVRES
jgi:riboflavin synthase